MFLFEEQVCKDKSLFSEFGWVPKYGVRETFEYDLMKLKLNK